MNRLAFVPPAWLLLLIAIFWAGMLAGGPESPPIVKAIAATGATILMFCWLWAIYRVSWRQLDGVAPARGQAWFAATILTSSLAYLAVGITGRPVVVGGIAGMILAVPLMVLFLGPFWLAAKALEEATAIRRPIPGSKALETAFTLAIFPFGAWAVRGKLLKIKTELATRIGKGRPPYECRPHTKRRKTASSDDVTDQRRQRTPQPFDP